MVVFPTAVPRTPPGPATGAISGGGERPQHRRQRQRQHHPQQHQRRRQRWEYRRAPGPVQRGCALSVQGTWSATRRPDLLAGQPGGEPRPELRPQRHCSRPKLNLRTTRSTPWMASSSGYPSSSPLPRGASVLTGELSQDNANKCISRRACHESWSQPQNSPGTETGVTFPQKVLTWRLGLSA